MKFFESFGFGRGKVAEEEPKVEISDADRLEKLEADKAALAKWMAADAVPEDAVRMDQIDAAIAKLKESM